MKKSELRHIIKESIKELINEQNPGSAGPGGSVYNPVDGNTYACNP